VVVAAGRELEWFELEVVTLAKRNPDWSWDEQILAFDLYLRRGLVGRSDPEVVQLSGFLQSLSIHQEGQRTPTFRNANGVARKLSDIHTHRPGYGGKKTSGSELDRQVWLRFGDSPKEVERIAAFIRGHGIAESVPSDDEAEIEEVHKEGRVVYRWHRSRERSAALRRKKVEQILHDQGGLSCEVCSIKLSDRYGEVGNLIYECHHLAPLHLTGPTETKLTDVALLCPACHRAAHRTRPWPSLEDLRAMVGVT
jgi:5-methylcytosine-specific restriction protein A